MDAEIARVRFDYRPRGDLAAVHLLPVVLKPGLLDEDALSEYVKRTLNQATSRRLQRLPRRPRRRCSGSGRCINTDLMSYARYLGREFRTHPAIVQCHGNMA
jgi:hypothetical protein